MTEEKVRRIINYSKDLGLALSIVFSVNEVQKEEYIDFNSLYFHDVWIVNDEELMLHDEINRRWITISIDKIKSIRIYEKVII